MSKATDELEDALTIALGKYIRGVVREAIATAQAEDGPVEDPAPAKEKKSSKDRRKEAAAKLDKAKAEEPEEEEEEEEEESEDEDEDEESEDEDEDEEEEEESEDEEPTEADVRDAVRAALKLCDRPEVIALMKKHGKSDKASGIKASLRGAVIDALEALVKGAKKGSKAK